MNKRWLNNKGSIDVVVVILIFIVTAGSVWIVKDAMGQINDKLEEVEENERIARQKGIETTALVIDKEVEMISTGKFAYNDYVITLYALKEEFKLSVTPEAYEQIAKNEYLKAVVKEDKILLGTKSDKVNVIRVIDEAQMEESK